MGQDELSVLFLFFCPLLVQAIYNAGAQAIGVDLNPNPVQAQAPPQDHLIGNALPNLAGSAHEVVPAGR